MKKKKVINIISGLSEDDPHARYKREEWDLLIQRTGDLRTVFVNLSSIAKDLNRRPIYIIKFFGLKLHTKHGLCSSKFLKKGVRGYCRGRFEKEKCESVLQEFIDTYCLCGGCKNPETLLILNEKDPDKPVYIECLACGSRKEIENMDRKMRITIYKKPPLNENVIVKKNKGKENMTIHPARRRRGIVWKTDCSPEAVKERRKKNVEMERKSGWFQELVNSPTENKKEAGLSVDITKYTPNQILLRILEDVHRKEMERKSTEEEEEEEEGEGDVEDNIDWIYRISDEHIYFAIREIKNRYLYKKTDIIRMICEVFLVENERVVKTSKIENFLKHHPRIMTHFFNKPFHEETLLRYLKVVCGRSLGLNFLPRVPVILFYLFDKGIVQEKIFIKFFKDLEGGLKKKMSRKARTSSKLFLTCSKPFWDWLCK